MVDEKWLRDYYRRQGKTLPSEVTQKPQKYHNVRTELDGRTYASKREAKRAAELKLMLKAGEIAAYAEQVPFALPGGIKYVADFVVFDKTGGYTVEDAKGVKTDVYKLKKRLMKSTYGIDIQEV